MNPRITVDRVPVEGTRMSGEIDIQFGLNESGDRVVWFGGDLRNDANNVASINGVDYVIAGLPVTHHPSRGWTILPSSRAWGMTKLGTYDGPTDAARRAFTEWANTQAPRLAEQHSTRWADLFAAAVADIDFDARRKELDQVLLNLVTYEVVAAMIAEAPNHRVVRFAQSVSCGWENGFASGNGGYNHHHHSGQAHAYLDIEIEGLWERVAVLVSGSIHSTTFTPIPISLVSLRHEPQLAE